MEGNVYLILDYSIDNPRGADKCIYSDRWRFSEDKTGSRTHDIPCKSSLKTHFTTYGDHTQPAAFVERKKLKSFWYILVDKKDVLISKLILLKYVKTCKN